MQQSPAKARTAHYYCRSPLRAATTFLAERAVPAQPVPRQPEIPARRVSIHASPMSRNRLLEVALQAALATDGAL